MKFLVTTALAGAFGLSFMGVGLADVSSDTTKPTFSTPSKMVTCDAGTCKPDTTSTVGTFSPPFTLTTDSPVDGTYNFVKGEYDKVGKTITYHYQMGTNMLSYSANDYEPYVDTSGGKTNNWKAGVCDSTDSSSCPFVKMVDTSTHDTSSSDQTKSDTTTNDSSSSDSTNSH